MVSQKNIRVNFEKTGKLQFISHLDLLRTMQTALRRAKVDVCYSEGFNPHQKITFALPLSIGIESECEFMDIKTDGNISCNEIKKYLGKNLPAEIKILDVYEADTKFTDIKYACYTVYLDFGDINAKAAEIGEKIFSGSLVVTKKTKSGDKEVDIKPNIRNISCTYELGIVIINTELCADSEKYLNPFYLIKALEDAVGANVVSQRVVRKKALTGNGNIFR